MNEKSIKIASSDARNEERLEEESGSNPFSTTKGLKGIRKDHAVAELRKLSGIRKDSRGIRPRETRGPGRQLWSPPLLSPHFRWLTTGNLRLADFAHNVGALLDWIFPLLVLAFSNENIFPKCAKVLRKPERNLR